MRKLLAAALCLAATATGCGATVESAKDPESSAVTLTNCGRTVTVRKDPRARRHQRRGHHRADVRPRPGGPHGRLRHARRQGRPAPRAVEGRLRQGPLASKDQLTKENVLDARADLVFAGWNYGFREDGGFTPDALRKLGIPSYILTESCRNGRTDSSRGIMPPLEALYTDLTNLGKLFGVEKRAAALIARFKKQIADVRAKAPQGCRPPLGLPLRQRPGRPVHLRPLRRPRADHHRGRRRQHHARRGGLLDHGRLGERRGTRPGRDRDLRLRRRERRAEEEVPAVPTPRCAASPRSGTGRIVALDYADLVESPRNPSAIARLGAYLRTR